MELNLRLILHEGAEAEIADSILYIFQDRQRVALMKLEEDRALRLQILVSSGQTRQVGSRQNIVHAQVQRKPTRIGQLAHTGHAGIDFLHRKRNMAGERRPVAGQLHTAPPALEERNAKLRFQRGDRAA